MVSTVVLTAIELPDEWFPLLKKVAVRRMQERGGFTEAKTEESGETPQGEISAQTNAEESGESYTIAFRKADLPEDAYRITPGCASVLIEASTKIGFLAGLGRFLRNSDFYPGKGFEPGRIFGTFRPEKPFRAIYYATHNYNFYHAAPKEEVFAYIEDSALWGQNALVVWYDMNHYTSVDSEESQEFIAFLKTILHYAKYVGMKIAFTSNANEAFFESEPELRAEWWPQNGYFREIKAHYHKEYCPSKPGGMEALLRDREAMLKAFSDVELDYFITWPYDQGGCSCKDCVPWGGNGYLRIARALRPLIKKYFPNAKMCLSAWYFDKFVLGEWDAFREEIEKGDYRDWIAYVVIDFKHNEPIPSFLKKDRSVAGIPMLDFTEISMFCCTPWGGFGTNADPGRFSGIWERLGPIVSGGLPYSEGIHEDVNKVIMLGYFYGLSENVDDILREYARFEFGPDVADSVVEVLNLMGSTLRRLFVREDVHPEGRSAYRYVLASGSNVNYILERVEAISEQLDETTRASWRWKIIELRARIDAELRKNEGFISETCNGYFRELQKIYHTSERTAYCCAPPTPDVVMNAHGSPMKKKPSKYGV